MNLYYTYIHNIYIYIIIDIYLLNVFFTSLLCLSSVSLRIDKALMSVHQRQLSSKLRSSGRRPRASAAAWRSARAAEPVKSSTRASRPESPKISGKRSSSTSKNSLFSWYR